MAKPRKRKNPRAARRGVFDDQAGGTWHQVLIQVPGRTGPVDLDELMDRLAERGVIGESRRDVAADLHAGRVPTPAGKWGLLVSMPGQSWAYLLPGSLDYELPAELARRSGLRVIAAGWQKTASATSFLCYEGEEVLVEFETCGMGGEVVEAYDPDRGGGLDQTKFRGTKLPRDWIRPFKSERAAQDALAKEFDAFIPIMGAWEQANAVAIYGFDRAEFEPADYLRIDLLGFGDARLETSPASHRLREALTAGDAEGIRSAVAAGADLRAILGIEVPPIHLALKPTPRAKSPRRELVATLVELGADADVPGHEPAALVVLGGFIADEAEVIGLLELLTAHGADVNARGREFLTSGRTPLHMASFKGFLGVAKYLVSRGADPRAVDESGRTPRQALEAASRRMNPSATEELRAKNAAVLAFLAEAEVGQADLDWRAEAEESSRRELRRRREMKVAMGRIGAGFEALGKVMADEPSARDISDALILSQPDRITLVPSTRRPGEAASILMPEGFKPIGRFSIIEMSKVRLDVYHHPREHLYAVIYDADGRSMADVIRYGRDGTSLTVTNVASPPGIQFDLPDHRKIRLAERPLAELLASLRAEPAPKSGVERVKAGEFVERFEKAYQREIKARKRRLRRG